MKMAVRLGNLTLKNPLVAASGVFGYGREYSRLGDVRWFGAVVTKGTTLKPRGGNPPPRIAETPCGMLNAIGLENPGVEAVIRHEIPWLSRFGVPVVLNAAGETYEEFAEIAAIADRVPGIDAIEVNVSCPNVSAGGMAFGIDARSVYRATRAVRKSFSRTLIVKLSPAATSVRDVARAAEEGGADAVSLINTLVGMAIDIRSRKPLLGNVTGGLSGPAVKPVALRCVWEASQAVSIPVIGMGGITGWQDAVEFMLAGARAVALGSGLLINPRLPLEILEGLDQYCAQERIADVGSLTGAAWKHQGAR